MIVDPLVVGFDLDMTLVDSREGARRTLTSVNADLGAAIDVEAVTSNLGPPLEELLGPYFSAAELPAAIERYRLRYTENATACVAMPGAREAVDHVRALGGRPIVVTAKRQDHARASLAEAGFEVDVVEGGRWGEDKATPLVAYGAGFFVGDHLLDVQAARAAGIGAIAVATGPVGADQLRASGADAVLGSLAELPETLDRLILERRLAALDAALGALPSLLVAFSGGVDSAFLLAAAVRSLGPDRVAAAMAVSPSLPGDEVGPATEFAAELGVPLYTPHTAELERAGYIANTGDRCYFCKAELFDVLVPLAAEHGFGAIATGTNVDDLTAGFRPGMRAARERGGITPLADAGLTKAQIRAASKAWGLVTWDKPQAACLASRIAYGLQITPRRLAQVERAERLVRERLTALGYRPINLRVRDLGSRARIEVDPELVEVLHDHPEISNELSEFESVEIERFRSGSMNELLAEPERFR